MKQNQLNRRGFFAEFGKYAGMFVAAPVLLKAFPAFADRARGGGAPAAGGTAAGATPTETWAKPGEGAAAAVKYACPKAKADASIKIDRGGVKYADQFCKNCNWYKEHAKKDGKACGNCQIINQNLVESECICGSWTKKA